MRRFEELWGTWEARLAEGRSRSFILPELTDEDVIELLTGAPEERRLDRNVLATEALNRMTRVRRGIVDAAHELETSLAHLFDVVAQSVADAREHPEDGTREHVDVRNEVREDILEHLRTAGAFEELAKLNDRLLKLKVETLLRARHPDMYAVG